MIELINEKQIKKKLLLALLVMALSRGWCEDDSSMIKEVSDERMSLMDVAFVNVCVCFMCGKMNGYVLYVVCVRVYLWHFY